MIEHGILVLASAVIGGGVLGALVRAWSWHSALTSLTNRVLVLEGANEDLRGNLLTEVKRRAGEARAATRRPKGQDETELEAVASRVAPTTDQEQWWWRQK